MLYYSKMRRLLPGWIEKPSAMHTYAVGQDLCETLIGRPLAYWFAMVRCIAPSVESG